MAKYLVSVTHVYEVTADREIDATIKATKMDSDVQLDEHGFRIDDWVNGVKYIGHKSEAVDVTPPEVERELISMDELEEMIVKIASEGAEQLLEGDSDLSDKTPS